MNEQMLKELFYSQFKIDSEEQMNAVIRTFQDSMQGSDFETAYLAATKDLELL